MFELHQLFCLRIHQVTIVFKTCLRWPIRVLIIINKLSCWFQVFCEKYNLSFHQPLKDACSKCTAYDLLPVDERTPELIDQRELHRTEAATVHQQKDSDVFRSLREDDVSACCFDLMQVQFLYWLSLMVHD